MSFLPVHEDEPFVMSIVGRRGSGKGYLVVDLLRYFYKGSFDFIVWISPTFELQDVFGDIPDKTGIVVFPEWRFEIVEALFAYMKMRNQGKTKNDVKETCLLVLDDVGALAQKGSLSEQLSKIAFTSRHFQISMIEITQRITLVSPGVRSQMNALLMFAEQNLQERTNLFRNFGFCEKKTFFDTFDRETDEKYSFIGIRNIGGRFCFFNLDGQVTPSRTIRTRGIESGNRDPLHSGLPRIRDSERHQDDL